MIIVSPTAKAMGYPPEIKKKPGGLKTTGLLDSHHFRRVEDPTYIPYCRVVGSRTNPPY